MIKKNFEKANILPSSLLHMQLTFMPIKIWVKFLITTFKCKASTWLIEKNDKFQLLIEKNMVLTSD